MDDARRASEEIYRRIRQQAGLSRSDSVGDITLQPAPLGIMTQGKLVLRRRTPERSQAGQTNVENPEATAGAVGGDTLLNIPPCSMAEGPGEQSQSLFRPPMSDPEVDLERRRGARPKVAGPPATQVIPEDWSEEYAECASSAKQSGAGLGTLRAEYVHRYNWLLEREKQPHSNFFVNLSEDFEDDLDFNEDRPADWSQYDQYFEWDEAEYMKL